MKFLQLFPPLKYRARGGGGGSSDVSRPSSSALVNSEAWGAWVGGTTVVVKLRVSGVVSVPTAGLTKPVVPTTLRYSQGCDPVHIT